MKKLITSNIFLLAILLVAFALRFYQLQFIPEGFYSDEAAFGYNAYSLLHTGKDEYGQVLPLSLKSFGDYKAAVYAYIAIPFVALMGLNEVAVRLPTVFFGTGFILLIYLIAYQLTKNRPISLISSGLGAISPLGILLSRMQNDPLVSVFFVVLGLYFFLQWLEKGNVSRLLTGGFFWIVSCFTYASPRLFVPVLLVLLSIFYGKKLLESGRRVFLPVFILVFSVAMFQFVGNSGERFDQLSVFSSPSVMLPLQEQIREEGPSSPLLARIFHNKLFGYGEYFLKGYSDYFTFDFLFLRGGLPDREIIPGMGVLYLIEFPFLLLGLYKIIEQRKRWGIFMISWLLAVPALLAFAVHESPNMHRFFLAALPLAVIGGYGIFEFYKVLRKHRRIYLLSLIIIPVCFLLSNLYFLHQLFVHQPVHMPWYRGHANKALAEELQKLEPNYKQVIVTKAHSTPYIYILFYQKYDPAKYQMEGSPRDLDFSGFGKYYFTPRDCPLNGKSIDGVVRGKEGVLYVVKGTCVTPKNNAKLIKTIYWGDNTPAFKLMEYVATKSAKLR